MNKFNLNKKNPGYKGKAIVIFFFLMSILGTLRLNAYPDFIGFGYTSCITCHYNGAGNGGLNDYGRGLFAAEIAAKPFWSSRISDEKLSQKSGFLGATELPFWFRPSIKYRGITVEKNPGSKEGSSKRYYQMQQDINLHMPLNEDQTFLVALNLGTVSEESKASPNKTFNESLVLSREYYLRGQVNDSMWFYFGFMDKVFGIRHPDHTSINRNYLGLGQNNQAHGFILHYVKDSHEFFANPFIGNLHLDRLYHYSGMSFLYEFEPEERWRLGLSFMRDRDTSNLEKNTLAFLIKRGIEGGHSVLFETGYRDALSITNSRLKSFYIWTQSSLRMIRGYFLQTNMEYFKADTTKLASENLKLGVGLLIFPIQRMEYRIFGVSTRTLNPDQFNKDGWSMQSQLHFSF